MAIAAAELGMAGSANAQSGKTNRPTRLSEARHEKSFGALKQIDAGVLNIGYAEAGPSSGPVVILLHGWPYDIYSFVDVAPSLASMNYRVIVPYVRGYGATHFLATRHIPQWAAVGIRRGHDRIHGCAQDRQGDPRRI